MTVSQLEIARRERAARFEKARVDQGAPVVDRASVEALIGSLTDLPRSLPSYCSRGALAEMEKLIELDLLH